MENALLSLDWNGVEEREELEGRRTKLTAQLDEAIALKVILRILHFVLLYFVFELVSYTMLLEGGD